MPKPRFTREEDRLICELGPSHTVFELQQFMPHRSIGSIRSRGYILKVEVRKIETRSELRMRIPAQPTSARPGSEEKIRVMEERVARGESPCHPADYPAGCDCED